MRHEWNDPHFGNVNEVFMPSVCLADNSTSVSISGDNSLHVFTSGGQCASGVFSCTCEAVDLVLKSTHLFVPRLKNL